VAIAVNQKTANGHECTRIKTALFELIRGFSIVLVATRRQFAASVERDWGQVKCQLPSFPLGHSICGFRPVSGNAARLLSDSNATRHWRPSPSAALKSSSGVMLLACIGTLGNYKRWPALKERQNLSDAESIEIRSKAISIVRRSSVATGLSSSAPSERR
jgi:hypothetical protein